MAEPTVDVAICGYGPTGMAAASLLSRRGHRVVVLERWPTLYGLPRIATIDGESARILQAASDIDAALRNSEPRTRYLFANEKGEVLIDHHWDKPHVCGFPFRISLHQPDIEDAMDAAARRRGVQVNQGSEVLGFTQSGESVTMEVRDRESSNVRSLEARYLIGADGARSTTRAALGIESDKWPTRNAWLTFDATRKRELPNFFGVSPDGRVAAIFCAPHGRSHSIIPLGRDHLRFNFETAPETRHDGALDRALAYAKLREVYGICEDDVDVYRQAIYPFEGRLARQWRKGRVFLAGDAAHVMTPFLGQGGCSALRDAINLSWKLDLVLRGIAPDTLLDSYEEERKPHARIHIEGSDRAGALAFVWDPDAASDRDRRLREAPPPAPLEPALHSGILDTEHPLAGTLGPQAVVRYAGREGRFDDLTGWGFQLLGWKYDPATMLDATQRAFLETLGSVVTSISEQDDVTGSYRRFFRDHDIGVMLVRPDFTIFGAVRNAAQAGMLVERLQVALRSRL